MGISGDRFFKHVPVFSILDPLIPDNVPATI